MDFYSPHGKRKMKATDKYKKCDNCDKQMPNFNRSCDAYCQCDYIGLCDECQEAEDTAEIEARKQKCIHCGFQENHIYHKDRDNKKFHTYVKI